MKNENSKNSKMIEIEIEIFGEKKGWSYVNEESPMKETETALGATFAGRVGGGAAVGVIVGGAAAVAVTVDGGRAFKAGCELQLRK